MPSTSSNEYSTPPSTSVGMLDRPVRLRRWGALLIGSGTETSSPLSDSAFTWVTVQRKLARSEFWNPSAFLRTWTLCPTYVSTVSGASQSGFSVCRSSPLVDSGAGEGVPDSSAAEAPAIPVPQARSVAALISAAARRVAVIGPPPRVPRWSTPGA